MIKWYFSQLNVSYTKICQNYITFTLLLNCLQKVFQNESGFFCPFIYPENTFPPNSVELRKHKVFNNKNKR